MQVIRLTHVFSKMCVAGFYRHAIGFHDVKRFSELEPVGHLRVVRIASSFVSCEPRQSRRAELAMREASVAFFLPSFLAPAIRATNLLRAASRFFVP
jgi:hypothetical protein